MSAAWQRRLPALLAAGLLMACAAPGASAHAPAVTVPVVACHTTFGVEGSPPKLPHRLHLDVAPRTVTGLVAYSNYYTYVIGPSGFACAGQDGADGSSVLTVWPHGSSAPRPHSRAAGITLDQVPSCVGCMAGMLCPFFPGLADRIFPSVPCATSIPTGERVRRLSARLVRFTDPPGVRGDGDPSGGPDAAQGADGYGGSRRGTFETTCTLPPRQQQVCATSLADAIARYG